MAQKLELSVQNPEGPKMQTLAVVEARGMMIEAVRFDPARHTKEVWIREASGALDIHPAFGKRLFYGELKRIDADQFRRMRDNLDALQKKAARLRERLDAIEQLRADRGNPGSASRPTLSTGARASRAGRQSAGRSGSGVR